MLYGAVWRFDVVCVSRHDPCRLVTRRGEVSDFGEACVRRQTWLCLCLLCLSWLWACDEPEPAQEPVCLNSFQAGCEEDLTPLCDLDDPACGYQEAGLCRDAAANDLFERRIKPLITDDRPSSCNRCHLTGLNLNLFVRDTSCEAMSCLIAQDLVNLEAPEESTILSWIGRGEPESNLITEEIVEREYEAFYEWISYSASCHQEVCAGAGLMCGDETPPEVSRPGEEPEPECDPEDHESCEQERSHEHREYFGPRFWVCEEDGMQKAFHDVIMPWTTRCEHCHVEDPLIDVGDPPAWLVEGVSLDSSAETMERLEILGAFDVVDPELSLFVRKPLDEDAGGVFHGGGSKFEDDSDPTYRDMLAWLRLYKRCKNAPEDAAREEGEVLVDEQEARP